MSEIRRMSSANNLQSSCARFRLWGIGEWRGEGSGEGEEETRALVWEEAPDMRTRRGRRKSAGGRMLAKAEEEGGRELT